MINIKKLKTYLEGEIHMNKKLLDDIIKKYKQHILNNIDIEAINERKERMKYYQSWNIELKLTIQNMLFLMKIRNP